MKAGVCAAAGPAAKRKTAAMRSDARKDLASEMIAGRARASSANALFLTDLPAPWQRPIAGSAPPNIATRYRAEGLRKGLIGRSETRSRQPPGNPAKSHRLAATVMPGYTFARKSPESLMPIFNRIAEFHDEIAAWRHDLHRHPEILYDVHRTAAVVADRLRDFGIDEVATGIGRTGV